MTCERLEHHNLVNTVQELGLEMHLQHLHHIATCALHHICRESLAIERRREVLLDNLRAHIRSHNDNGIAEINRATLIVRKATIVQHLQQDVKYIGVCLLNLIEQYHRIGLATHRLGKLTTLIIAHISRRCSHQA